MEGEDEDSDDDRAFSSQKPWKKVIILVAGAAMNFLLGLVVIIVLYSGASGFGTNKVIELADGFKYGENGIQVGDVIYSIDGARIYYTNDFQTYMNMSTDGKVDMVVIRDGKKVTLKDYGLQPEYYMTNGEEVYRYGLSFEYIKATPLSTLKYSCNQAYNFVRMVWLGLKSLATGAVGVKDMSGVVGVVSTINDVAEESSSTSEALENVAYLCAFIAINLAVMNMLPIPALDGGRVFFLIINVIIEGVTHKKLDPKYEGYIHTAGFAVLMCLMVYIMFNDIMKIIK
jgi:regulator of sigma E protease